MNVRIHLLSPPEVEDCHIEPYLLALWTAFGYARRPSYFSRWLCRRGGRVWGG
jgi:hypothetical protein